jgi:hypothetical protein
VSDALGAAREGRKRLGSIKVSFEELDAGSRERRFARAHQGRNPIAIAQLWQGPARDIAATDDQ